MQIEVLILNLHRDCKLALLLVEQFMDFALSVGNAFSVMETGAFEAERAKEYLAI